MRKHYLSLTEPQIEKIKGVRPEFDTEEVEFTGEYIIEDESFDHEYGTEYMIAHVLNCLSIKIGAGDWRDLLINGCDNPDAIINLSENQLEKCLASLQKKNVY